MAVRRFFLLPVLFLFSLPANGQMAEFLGIAPASYGLHYDHLDGPAVRQVIVTVARRVPLPLLLPNVSADSDVALFLLATGRRFGADATTTYRWRAALLDMNIYRAPWGGGLTLIDVDRSGMPEQYTRWVALRLGPAFRVGGFSTYLEPRLIGHVALASLQPHEDTYPDLAPLDGDTATSLEFGGSAALVLHVGPRLALRADAARHQFTGGLDPRRTRAGGSLSFLPDPRLLLFVEAMYEETTLGPQTQTFTHVRLGLRLSPAAF